jgi:hypothetical protein
MTIFGRIVSAIFGKSKSTESPPASPGSSSGTTTAADTTTTAAGSAAPPQTGGPAKAAPMTREQVEAKIQKVAEESGHKDYNWRQSIVDLMKLLNLDSSLSARKQLAQELGYTGALDGSAEMNTWLHKQVMAKLMESGGVVPDSLR